MAGEIVAEEAVGAEGADVAVAEAVSLGLIGGGENRQAKVTAYISREPETEHRVEGRRIDVFAVAKLDTDVITARYRLIATARRAG